MPTVFTAPIAPIGPIVPVGLGDFLGDQLANMIASAFDAAMTAIWFASLGLLKGAFGLADAFSEFTVSTTDGPLKILWPVMLWISGMLALGLFFWQLVLTNLRGGRGFLRLATGPVQYGIALAVTVGMVATFLTAVDALTSGILSYGLQAQSFTDAFSHTSLGGVTNEVVDAVVLGISAFVGVIPAAIGYTIEMLFREAAIYVLVATVPIVAAGLLANVTAKWFWITVRWLIAAIAMKPVLAMALVLGVAIAGGSQGVAGLLAGVGVLIVSLACPFALFRLFAFVDPNTDAGAGFRNALSGLGIDSYGSDNAGVKAAGALDSYAKSGGSGEGGGDAIEKANTSRFDDAADQSGDSADHAGGQSESGDADASSPSGSPGSGTGDAAGDPARPGGDDGATGGDRDGGDSSGGGQGGGEGGGGDHGPPDAPPTAGGPPAPPPPDGGGGGGGPGGGGGSGGGSGAEEAAEDAAVAM